MFTLIDNLIILAIVAFFGTLLIITVLLIENHFNKRKEKASMLITKAKEEACKNRKR